MSRHPLILPILALFLLLGLGQNQIVAGPAIEQHTFVEDFGSQGLMDAAHTTADWDMVGQVVRKVSTDQLISSERIDVDLPIESYCRTTVFVPETGLAYIFGGRVFQGPSSLDDVMVLDPLSETVTVLENALEVPVVCGSAVYVPELRMVYILGGGNGWGDHIQAFDPFTGTGIVVGHLPRPIWSVGALYVPERRLIYYFGGLAVGEPINEMGIVDPFTNEAYLLGNKMPELRFQAPAAYLRDSNTIRIYGPGDTGNGSGASDSWITDFDLTLDRVRMPDDLLPQHVRSTAAAYVEDQETLYFFDPRRRKILLIDLSSGSQTFSPVVLPDVDFPSAERFANGFYAANRHALYLVGGYIDRTSVYRVDFGYGGSGVAQSGRINLPGAVISASLSAETYVPAGQSIAFELSNDGGQSWQHAAPGAPVMFGQTGDDLRWRATLSGPGTATAYLNQLTITYDLQPMNELTTIHFPLMAERDPWESDPPPGNGQGINGLVTYKGNPQGGVLVELRFFNGSSWESAGMQHTAANGSYQFIGKPGLQPGQAYYVRYGPNSDNSNNLYLWANNLIRAYEYGERRLGGNFDVVTINLIGPDSPNPTASPVQFSWQRREGMGSEPYDLEVFYPNLADVFFGSTTTGGMVLTNPIPGVESLQLYGWTVWANSALGTGVSFDVYLVKFGEVGTPVQPPTLAINRSVHFSSCLEANYHPSMNNVAEAAGNCQQIEALGN